MGKILKKSSITKPNPKLHWYSIKEKFEYSSGYHAKVRDILLTNEFKNLEIFQEVPLSDLVDTNAVLYLDFWIKTFGVGIEVQGEQHYRPVSFGNVSAKMAIERFQKQEKNDNLKRKLLEENGFKLVTISYLEVKDLNYEKLMLLFRSAIRG